MAQPKRRHSHSRKNKRRHPRLPEGGGPVRLPQLQRTQATPPHLRATAAITRASRSSRARSLIAMEPVHIAVDAMGGDHAPAIVIEGVVDYLRENDSGEGLQDRPGRQGKRDPQGIEKIQHISAATGCRDRRRPGRNLHEGAFPLLLAEARRDLDQEGHRPGQERTRPRPWSRPATPAR